MSNLTQREKGAAVAAPFPVDRLRLLAFPERRVRTHHFIRGVAHRRIECVEVTLRGFDRRGSEFAIVLQVCVAHRFTELRSICICCVHFDNDFIGVISSHMPPFSEP